MGMKKKMLSATLCAVMVGSLAAPAFTVQAADDTLVYWSMWEATEPQVEQILCAGYFGCGMAFKSHAGISRGHSFPVINDLDESFARIL